MPWKKNKMRIASYTCHPLLAINPQLILGGDIPKPKKLNVDSAKIAEGMVNVKVTIIGASILGNSSLNIILCRQNHCLCA